MWSIAVYDFGLSGDEFWKLTPAQFHALSKRKDINRQMEDLGFGIVASVIANCNRDPKKHAKPYTPKDFLPDYSGKKKENLSPRMLLAKWQADVLPHFKVVDLRT